MEWKDTKKGEGIDGAVSKVGCFRLSVHHYIGCGDTWFVSCYGIFDRLELGQMSLNEARVMAGAKLQIKLEDAIKAIVG